MKDPTFLILSSATGVAFAVLLVGVAWRALAGAGAQQEVGRGVDVSYYRAVDWVWAGLLCVIFLGLSLGSAWMAKPAEAGKISPQQLVESMGLQVFIAGLTMMLMVWRVKISEWLGLRWAGWPRVFLVAPATVVAMWIVFAVIQKLGYMTWLESMGLEQQQDSVKLLQETKDPQVLVLMAIAAVVVAPLCEEVVFRGFLYPLAKRYAGMWVAMIFSGVVFAVAHSSVVAVVPLAVFGVVLAVLYERTRSIWAPIAAHALFNGATVTVQLLIRFEVIPMPQQ